MTEPQDQQETGSFEGATYRDALTAIQFCQQAARLAEERWRAAKKQSEAALEALRAAADANQLRGGPLLNWFVSRRTRKGRLNELELADELERLTQLDTTLSSAHGELVLLVSREQLIGSGIPTLELLRLQPYEPWPVFQPEAVQLRTFGLRVATLSWSGIKIGLSASIGHRHAVRPFTFFADLATGVTMKSSSLPKCEVIAMQHAITQWADSLGLNEAVEKLIIALHQRERDALK